MIKVNFKKELEAASRGMINIHDPELLIKLIVRMIVRKLHVKHAGMILFEPAIDAYVLKISRGEAGEKIPVGYTRFDSDSPIIQLFIRKEFRPLTINRSGIVANEINRMIWREGVINNAAGEETKELLRKVDEQMQMLNTVACVPAFYQDKLMAVLLLGEKKDETKYKQEELDFFAALASDVAMAIRNAQLFEGMKIESERNKQLFFQTIKVLGSAIEAKDAYTRGHTERVTNYALLIARQMTDSGSEKFNKEFFVNLRISGLLHDIGKIGIPEKILNKTKGLTDKEFEKMKEHTLIGVAMVSPLNLPKICVDGIRSHHESYNGRGYPDGLKGDEIPIVAAVIAVGDAFDAMTSDRPYRRGMSKEDGINEIKKCSGTQFHPFAAKALIELFEMGKI